MEEIAYLAIARPAPAAQIKKWLIFQFGVPDIVGIKIAASALFLMKVGVMQVQCHIDFSEPFLLV